MCLKRLLWKSTEKTDLESLTWALAPAGLWPAAQSIEKFSMLCADQIFWSAQALSAVLQNR